MNIDKIFYKSFKFFNDTINSVLPFIAFYSIIIILINYLFGSSELSEENLLLYSISIESIISLLITYFINLLYSILIIQFIFSKIKKINIKFNFNSIVVSIYRITGLYIIIFFIPVLLSMTLADLNPLSGLLLSAIPFFYLSTFFSQYLIIDKQKHIIESMLLSYNIIKEYLSRCLILMFINIIFIILMVYLAIIIAQFLPIINSILLNIQLYFVSIFNIQFYSFLIKKHTNDEQINE